MLIILLNNSVLSFFYLKIFFSEAKTMEQNITALCDIDPMLDDIKILARCISVWKSHPKGKPNEIWSLDMILQDPHVIL